MSKRVSIAVIGKGKVGSSLAARIVKMRQGYELFAHLAARASSFKKLASKNGPDVIFITSKDDKIVPVAKKALKFAGKNLHLLIHCAGSRESIILPGRHSISRLTLHPMQTFSEADPVLLENIYYMASSDDMPANIWAKKFVKDIGGIGVIKVRGKDLPLYHVLVVFASNFTTLLGGAVEMLSQSLRIPPATMKKAVAPLMLQSLENVLQNNAAKVLTGPIARNDRSTIMKHRKVLRSQPAVLRNIYEGFVKMTENIGMKNK